MVILRNSINQTDYDPQFLTVAIHWIFAYVVVITCSFVVSPVIYTMNRNVSSIATLNYFFLVSYSAWNPSKLNPSAFSRLDRPDHP